MNIEILGTIASLLIISSLISSNIKWLRVLNLIGSVIFVLYASITGAFSVGLTNSFGVIFNIYHLIKIYKKEESYD